MVCGCDALEAMQPHFPRICRARRNNYERLLNPQTAEALTAVLSQTERLPSGLIEQIHNETGIPVSTLKKWRQKLLRGVNPFDYAWRHRPVLLTDAIEDQIYQAVLERLASGVCCPVRFLTRVALEIGRQENASFQAGRSWIRGFLRRHELSVRRPHTRRRTAPDDDAVAKFLQFIEVARMEIPEVLIANMDETAWRLSNGRLQTLAKRGSDEVTCFTQVDERTCLTVICTITASGKKLAPWVIVKGKTERAEQRYRDDPRINRLLRSRRLFIAHSENGWSDADVMKSYLEWFSNEMGNEWSLLLWDLHSSHRCKEVKDEAVNRHVNLSFIPAGQTSVWQPLDRKIFGMLKAKAQKKLNELCAVTHLDSLTMADALVILLQAWNEIPAELVRKSWNHIIPMEQQLPDQQARTEEFSEDDQWEEEEEEEEDGDAEIVAARAICAT